MARLQLHPRLRSDLIMYPIGWSAGFEMPILSFYGGHHKLRPQLVLHILYALVKNVKRSSRIFRSKAVTSMFKGLNSRGSASEIISAWVNWLAHPSFSAKKASCKATIWLALIFHILQNQPVNDMMFNRNAITLATSYSKLSNITSCDPYLGVCTNGGSPKWMV